MLLTQKLKFCILAYDTATKTVVTRLTGDVKDRVGRPSEIGHRLLIDPSGRFMAFFVTQGLLKVLVIDYPVSKVSSSLPSLTFKELFNVR